MDAPGPPVFTGNLQVLTLTTDHYDNQRPLQKTEYHVNVAKLRAICREINRWQHLQLRSLLFRSLEFLSLRSATLVPRSALCGVSKQQQIIVDKVVVRNGGVFFLAVYQAHPIGSQHELWIAIFAE
jgi:hypothetical protein